MDNKNYKDYLDSVFQEYNDTYYLNIQTKEIVPSKNTFNKSNLRIINASYLCLDNDIIDIYGNSLINNSKNNAFYKIISIDRGIAVLKKDKIIYLLNLYNGEFVYQTKDELQFQKSGIIVFEHNFFSYVISPDGRILTKNDKYQDTVEYQQNNILEVTEKYLKYPKDFKFILTILKEFNVSSKMVEKIMEIMKNDTSDYNFRYNNSFLAITSRNSITTSKKMTLLFTKDKVLYANFNQFCRYDFNDNTMVILKKDNCSEISYDEILCYDKTGNLFSSFKDIKNSNKKDLWLKIDNYFYELLNKGLINVLGIENDFLKFKLNAKIYYCDSENIKFYCNRLLVQDESGLFGYIDQKGEEVISPKYIEASIFEERFLRARVKKANNLSVYINNFEEPCRLNELSTYDSYYGKFNKIYELPPNEQIIYSKYKSNYNWVLGSFNYTYYDTENATYAKCKYEPMRLYKHYLIVVIRKSFGMEPGFYALDLRSKRLNYINSYNFLDEKNFFDDYFVINNVTYYVQDKIIRLGNYSLCNRRLKKDIDLLSKEEFATGIFKKSKSKIMVSSKEVAIKKKKELLLKKQAEIQDKMVEIRQKEEEIKKLRLLHSISLPDDFFIIRKNIKIINAKYLSDLKYYDLLTADFTNCVVSGIDFRKTNALIDPQRVYNKDFSNGNYCDVVFLNYNFDGVNIFNAVFNNEFIEAYQTNMLKLKKVRTEEYASRNKEIR